MLVEGNKRFATNKPEHPHQSPELRAELSKGQHPFAVVVACADSRTAPEVIFDEGLGDLFVIRIAGNVVSDEVLGSVEYAVEHLGVKLVVVLGHEKCGAVKAARDTIAAGQKAAGHVQSLIDAIEPAVKMTAGQDAEATGKANDINMAKVIREAEPLLKNKVSTGELVVVSGSYDLDTGKVEFFPPPEGKVLTK